MMAAGANTRCAWSRRTSTAIQTSQDCLWCPRFAAAVAVRLALRPMFFFVQDTFYPFTWREDMLNAFLYGHDFDWSQCHALHFYNSGYLTAKMMAKYDVPTQLQGRGVVIDLETHSLTHSCMWLADGIRNWESCCGAAHGSW